MEKITWHFNSKSTCDFRPLKFDAPIQPWLRFLKSDPGRLEDRDWLPTNVFEGKPLQPIQPLHGPHSADEYHSQPQDDSKSEIDADRLKLQRALKKVADLRDGLYGKRLKLKERRNELRQELSILSEADAKFMKAVRQYCSRNHVLEDDFEENHYTDMEKQRDVVGSLQYDYDQEEGEHDVAENELVVEEDKLSIMVSKFLDQGNDQDDQEALRSNPSSGRHLLLQETIYPPKTDKEAAIEEYQSRQGDARIMQERLADLQVEEAVRRSFAQKRENIGWGFVESEGDFAEEFKDQYFEIADELEIIQADVKRLKEGLVQSGYLDSEPASTIQPADLYSLPPTQPSPRIQAQTPVQVGRKRAKSDSIAPFLENEISAAHVRRTRVSQWILVTFGSSPVKQSQQNAILRDLEVEVMVSESLDEKKWTRTARLVFDHLKKHNEFDDESWDEIVPQDLQSYTPDKRASQPGDLVFLEGMLEVKHAVNRLDEQFPHKAEEYDHRIPYGPSALTMDLHPEYESRSC